MSTRSIISAHHLTIGYPKTNKEKKNILHRDFSFNLYEGELTCLLGENGAGKSTLLRTITGLQKPLSGNITLFEKNLKSYKKEELSTLLGVVLTEQTTAGGFTVSEMVGMGRYPYTGFFGKFTSTDYEIIEQSMNDVGITHKSTSYMAELSDGERQKVMIAKALAQECPVIILDEPTAFLDIVNRIEIMNLLHSLAIHKNKTILLSTHDIELSLLLADRLWLLAKNKTLISGVTEDIVLSDSLNDYIGNSNIRFDKNSGKFLTKSINEKEVYLEGEGELFYWTQNFLARNGYRLTNNPLSDLYIHIISASEIDIIRNHETLHLKSFEELYSIL